MISLAWSVERLLQDGAAAGPVLGFATGGTEVSLGLVAHGRIQGVLSRSVRSHCAGLPAAVEELLETAGLSIRDLGGIGVAVGPGSFTGLRVGLSYAKGLAQAAGLPLAGIPTCDAMAMLAGAEGSEGVLVCPILDARRGQLYTALYQFSGDALERKSDDLALTTRELADLIDREAILIGEGPASEVQALAISQGRRITLRGAAELYRTGSLVAAMAAARIEHNQVDDGATLEPRYVRGSDAARQTAS